ncbi:diphthine--ammonia ligase [Methanobrevibacter filiformis]|uniref:ATP-binding region n=1 Tax=Methanobrevibacter filiformis TaxID=55758 RepID=A0A166FDS7_9EURY|nr:TIGR00289 family protein [Methanobrevibacter filiformis]KZX17571.1 ATP-binding region [Methanobrevibacter filiformis]
MNVAILFSGGKDSTMALYRAIAKGHDVKYLFTMVSENKESYMFHVPNIHINDLIAEALEIPLLKSKTDGKKEKELDDLENALIQLKDKGIEAIYSGALFSTYQKSRIDALCEKHNLKSIAPLWHVNTKEYMREIVDLGFEVIISGVFAEGLDESWLGRTITKESINELIAIEKKHHINIAFEGGEAETLVIDGPIFKKRIKIVESEKQWDVDNGIYEIKKAILEEKSF